MHKAIIIKNTPKTMLTDAGFNTYQLDMSSLSNGAYIVKVKEGDKTNSFKVIKN